MRWTWWVRIKEALAVTASRQEIIGGGWSWDFLDSFQSWMLADKIIRLGLRPYGKMAACHISAL